MFLRLKCLWILVLIKAKIWGSNVNQAQIFGAQLSMRLMCRVSKVQGSYGTGLKWDWAQMCDSLKITYIFGDHLL